MSEEIPIRAYHEERMVSFQVPKVSQPQQTLIGNRRFIPAARGEHYSVFATMSTDGQALVKLTTSIVRILG